LAIYKIVTVDFWIHLASGRELFLSRGLPKVNTFSYTFPDYPWQYVVGPFQLLLYLVYLVGGFPGIIVFKALLLCLTFYCLWRIAPDETSANTRFLILFLCAIVMRERFSVRPQLIFFLFSACYYYALFRYQQDGKPKHLYLLIPLQLLWVNIHGSFIIGIFLLGLFCLIITTRAIMEDYLPRLAFLIRDKACPIKIPWLVFLGLLLASLLNPQGYQVFLHPFEMSSQQIALITVAERQPVGADRLFGYYGVLLALSCLGLLRGLFRRQWFASLSLAVFALLSLGAIRFIGIFGVAAAAALPGLLTAGLPGNITNYVSKRRFSVILAIIAIITGTYICTTDLNTPFGWGVNQLTTPVSAVDFLEQNKVSGPIYNDIDLGDYLIWRLYPKERVFIDGRRFAAYPKDFYEKMEFLHSATPAWAALMRKYDFNIAVLAYSPIGYLELFPRRDWALVYWDDAAVIFLRRNQANSQVIAQNEFKNFTPNRFSDLKTTHPALRESYLADLRRARDQHPESYRVNFALGYLYSWQGPQMLSLAETYLKRAISLCPPFAPAYAQLGLVYRNLGKPKEAIRLLRQSLRISPDFRIAHFYLSTTYDILGDRKKAAQHMKMYNGT